MEPENIDEINFLISLKSDAINNYRELTGI